LQPGMGSGEMDEPALVIDRIGLGLFKSPSFRRDQWSFITRHAGAAKMPADAAGLHPSGKWPPFGVGRSVMLLGEHIPFCIDGAIHQRCAPAFAHGGQGRIGHAGRPEGGQGHPFIPQRAQGAGWFIMQPEQVAQSRHLPFISRNGKSRKICRRLAGLQRQTSQSQQPER